jgi:hypothetical protein
MSKTHSRLQQNNQQGLVSITVAIVFVMVVSLIVLGFSQVSRRNSSQALDRQLSSQAYYAAESAINDTIYKISKDLQTGVKPVAQTTCDGIYTKNEGKLQDDSNIKYTCLKVKTELKDYQYSQVSDTIVVPLNSTTGTLGSNRITWTREANPAEGASLDRCDTRNTLPDGPTWGAKCPFGLLRVDIMPMSPGIGGTVGNPQNAAAQTMTVFLYPRRSGAAVSVPYRSAFTNPYGNTVTQGAVLAGACDDNTCEVTVTGLDFTNAFMRVQSLYNPAQNLKIATTESNKDLEGGQIEIDATGKAQDVLRRINVRYPLVGSSRADVPGFSANTLQSSGSICKYFSVSPGRYDSKDARCN